MGKINWARVFIGGLLAGIVMFALGYVFYGLWLSKEMGAAMQALGRPPMAETVGTRVFILVMSLVSGIIAVWFYAAIRPRFGPGPKTAALAGFWVWVIGGLLPTIWYASLDLFPRAYMAKDAGAGLVLWVVATLVGAWAYKE